MKASQFSDEQIVQILQQQVQTLYIDPGCP
jgi:hypothetical protein